MRILTTRFLERAGHIVSAFARGDQAIEAAGSLPFDVLVTDMRVPGMSGRRVAAEVSARRPGIPVIYVSGHTDEAILRDGLREPGSQFLAKPFTAAEILSAVGSAARELRP